MGRTAVREVRARARKQVSKRSTHARPGMICSNVQQFHEIIGMIQMCYHTNHCACWPCFVNTRVFICYKTEKGTLMILSFTRVTLRVLALLGQVTWTGTVCCRGG